MLRALRLTMFATVFQLLSGAAWAQSDTGLVALWNFDEGKGDLARDSSGNDHDGKIHGATFVRRGNGHALYFDGINDYVDCGNKPDFNMREAVTLSAWVYPEALPSREPAIAMNGWTGNYGLTFYKDGRCYWYASGRARVHLGIGVWHHVVGTWDGKTVKLYLDGRIRVSKPSKGGLRLNGKNFMIGRQPNTGHFFKGMIDEVRLYSRALSESEIASAYKMRANTMTMYRPPITSGPSLQGEGFLLRVGDKGGMQLEVGKGRFLLDASFSYPGRTIGRNYLSQADLASDPLWKPQARQVSRNAIAIEAKGKFYALARRIELQGHRISISDRLTNTGTEDVGILVRNLFLTEGESTGCLLGGAPLSQNTRPSNPTILLSQVGSRLGVVAEDNVSRTQFQSAHARNRADFSLNHLAIQPGKGHTLEWAVYPLFAKDDYWSFINRVRQDWNVNFKIIGPGDMLNVTYPPYWDIFTDRKKCAAFLKRSKLKVLALGPWLDYDNHNRVTGKLVSREDYKKIFQKVKTVIKSVAPEVKILGNLEAPFVSLPQPLVEKLLPHVPKGKRSGYFPFNDAQMQIMKNNPEGWARWQDSVYMTRDNRMQYEVYRRGEHVLMALTVRPVLNNGQHKYLMEQARFIKEEVGLDGVYVDGFGGRGYSYGKWDGLTVDIDRAFGHITRKYQDMGLAGIESRKKFLEYVLSNDGIMISNGHPCTRDIQSLRNLRFSEGEWAFEPLEWKDGEKPPLKARTCVSHLSTPLALGFRPLRIRPGGKENYATVVVKGAIAYLRHGMLYFHYGTLIPESGPGSGEYGPFNHMFPITPVRLGEGFVIGKERTITAVSGTYQWKNERKPTVLVFDITGRPTEAPVEMKRSNEGWSVTLNVEDWENVVVIE